jgi:hypothetical protein
METFLSAIFVMFVVFVGFVILYASMKIFTAIVRAIESNVIDKAGEKKRV